MGGPVCNTSLEDATLVETPIRPGLLSLHHIFVIVVAICAALSVGISAWLMVMHATHYSHPRRQRQILRILLIIPVYSFTALLITVVPHHYVYFIIISELYEPLCIISYLTLLLYLGFSSVEELEVWLQSRADAVPWIFPCNLLWKITGKQKGPFRTPRRALTQFNIIWFCVYQYCIVRSVCTIAGVIAQATGKYCLTSLDPHFAHLWLIIFPAISTSFAMHTLIQAHWTLRKRLAHHHVHTKLLSIKLVVFFTFWQGIVFGIVTNKIADKLSPFINRVDVQVIVQYMLLSAELVGFAILHIKAYPATPYMEYEKQGHPYQGGLCGWRAFVDCINLSDVGQGIHKGCHWMFVGFKYRNMPDDSLKGEESHELVANANAGSRNMFPPGVSQDQQGNPVSTVSNGPVKDTQSVPDDENIRPQAPVYESFRGQSPAGGYFDPFGQIFTGGYEEMHTGNRVTTPKPPSRAAAYDLHTLRGQHNARY